MERPHLFDGHRNQGDAFLGLLLRLALAPTIKLFVSRHFHKDNRVSGNLGGNFGMLQDVLFKLKNQVEVFLVSFFSAAVMAILLLKIFHGKPTNALVCQVGAQRLPQRLFEDHARKRHRRAGLRRECLAVVKIIAARAVEQVNQRIKRREAADFSFVLILRDLIEESRRVQFS